MPRFAVLNHDFPFVHWDFLLEKGSVCQTWRLLQAPGPDRKIDAESLPDHRLIYLTYEGPVSGDRGTVTSWDCGTFEWQINHADDVEVLIRGSKLAGSVKLMRIAANRWTWQFSENEVERS